MSNIASLITERSAEAGSRLLPTRVFRLDDIPADQQITSAYRELAARNKLGQQYDWLARLAKHENTKLELSIHADDKFRALLGDETVADENGVHHLKADASNPVFRWFMFPILNVSKLDMEAEAARHGFSNIMETTWFCFTPLLDGKPCGFCNPCRYAREEGLGRRVPNQSLTRKLQSKVLNRSWVIRNAALRSLKQLAPTR